MEFDSEKLSQLFPQLSAQLRLALYSLHLASAQLVPPEQREKDPALDQKAALLDQSYYRLLRLVNNLNAAVWLGQEHRCHLKNQDLVPLVQEVFASAGTLAPLLGLQVSLNCPKESHLCAMDRSALEQLLYHLVSNAMKFTPAGGALSIDVKFLSGYVQISVTDTGCGIAPQRLETLFEPAFTQTDAPPPVPPQGLGLGLPLCRAIAQTHGGSLLAQSEEGKGSRFTLSLPDRLAEETDVSDLAFDYSGGFNRALLNLADSLPVQAFLIRNQD